LTSPNQTSPELEEAIVRCRKRLAENDEDAGARSIVYRLGRDGWDGVPSVATVHRILVRTGHVVSQPEKRPRSSFRRFVWPAPNGAWQIDATRWVLSGGGEVWVMDVLDDHSRLVPAAVACSGPTSDAAWNTLCVGGERFGLPAHVISDNGLCFTGRFLPEGGEVGFEHNLRAAGIGHIRSTPGHPQTCGKLERWHQTLKKWLRARSLAGSIEELQAQLDQFLTYYNTVRPHQALHGATPLEAWQATTRDNPGKPTPSQPGTRLSIIDGHGRISVGSWVIQVDARLAGKQVLVIRDHLEVTIISDGTVLRKLSIDPTRRYQPNGQPPGRRPTSP
jgi:transposase InsO family protein